jgi:hypothetical protein
MKADHYPGRFFSRIEFTDERVLAHFGKILGRVKVA